MDKQLRLITAEMILSSDLPKQAKIQMLNFVKEEATDAQVKALLMDGKIIPLDEISEEVVNARFELSEAGGKIAQMRKSYMTQAGSGGGLNPMWIAYRAVRGAFDKCTQKCGTLELNTARRQHCMIQCKAAKAQGELTAAKKSGDGAKIAKAQKALIKAQALMKKSAATFNKAPG